MPSGKGVFPNGVFPNGVFPKKNLADVIVEQATLLELSLGDAADQEFSREQWEAMRHALADLADATDAFAARHFT